MYRMGKESRKILLLLTFALFLGSAPGIQAKQNQPTIKDSKIAQAIEIELLTDDSVSAHLIDVEVEDGIVNLSGSIDNILAKDRATKIAESIKGVRAVTNRITVKPPKRNDETIEGDIRQAFQEDQATDSYQIDVNVDDGEVTLRGTVDSWAEKSLCGEVAKSVTGVKSLQNNITISYAAERLDNEIATEIRRRLESDIWVNAYLLDVEVDDGKVELSGTMGSAAEKRRAASLAWVSGVVDVDSTDVDVDWWARDKMQRREIYADRSDKEIEEAVRDAFLYDPRVFSFQPDVEVNDGVVTLSGEVGNLKVKRAAEQDAKNTVGVWRVKNYIRVRPAAYVSDAEIEDRIDKALERNAYTYRPEITPVVVNGKVYLYGTVDSEFEKEQAEEVVSKVKGVIEVENHIDVDFTWTYKTDWEIKEDIQSELWWSPFVDSDEITVSVDNAEATLSGTVDTWGEVQAAVDNAYEGGARSVVNDLKVRYGPRYYRPGTTAYGAPGYEYLDYYDYYQAP